MIKPARTRVRRLRLGAVLTGLAVVIMTGGCLGPGAAQPTPATPPADPIESLVPAPTPTAAGPPSSAVDDAQLIAAVPSCRAQPCRLLARVNDFGVPGGVAALLAWDRTDSADPNYELIVTSATGDLLWRAPDQRLGHVNGYERFTVDGPDRLFLPLAAEPRGQTLTVLQWRNGDVDDRKSLSTPRFRGDSVAFAEDRDKNGTAEIITQSTQGLADAESGGLVEATYTLVEDDYRLTGCRQRQGESFQWTTRPSRDGRCTAS
ncbi:hypothetical protein [Actinoplanes sp. NPDC049599]|uniref:hypothetical protein n=1 Tax=Actinoplanes sp. NPDC049599 TaxID=3363903 RepID=UPI0037B6BD8B